MTDTINRIPDTPGARHSHSRIPDEGHNYVINGVDLGVDNGELTVSAGSLLVRDDSTNEIVHVDVTARYGSAALPLPDSGTVAVYYDVDALEVATGSEPSGLSLKLGDVPVDTGDATPANTVPDRRADSFTTEDAHTKSSFTDPSGSEQHGRIEGAPPSAEFPGGWIWFCEPCAVTYNSKTYFTYVTEAGEAKISSINHKTGETTTTTLHTGFSDDHANPALLVRNSDGRIVTTYSDHFGTTAYSRVSTDPEDISSFQSETSVTPRNEQTYSQLAQLSDENDKIYWFFRDQHSGGNSLAFRTSTDGGESWSAATDLITIPTSTYGEYWNIGTNGVDRIDLSLTKAEGPTSGPKVDIKHIYIKDGYVHGSDGSQLGSLSGTQPITSHSAATMVYDTATGHHAWTWDCTTSDGNPQIVYAELRSTTDHRYRYAKWVGSSWVDNEIVPAGSHIANGGAEEYYSAGIKLDESRDGLAYLATGDEDSTALHRYHTPDNGESWSNTQLTGRSTQIVRPVVPRNEADIDQGPHPDAEALWMQGQYVTPTNFNTAVSATAPKIWDGAQIGSGQRLTLGDGGDFELYQDGAKTRFVNGRTGDTFIEFDSDNEKLVLKNLPGEVNFTGPVDLNDSDLLDPSNNVGADSMTSNPETDVEDGYIEVVIDGQTRQIPFYNP